MPKLETWLYRKLVSTYTCNGNSYNTYFVAIWFTDQHDFVGIDTKENRLLFYASEADLDDNLVVKKSLLKR